MSKSKESQGKTSKFLDLIAKVISILENIPKALAGLLLVISLLGGATGVISALTPDDEIKDVAENRASIHALEEELEILRAERKLMYNLMVNILVRQGVATRDELSAFIIELPSGDIEKVK